VSSTSKIRTIPRAPKKTDAERSEADLMLAVCALDTIAHGLSTPVVWRRFAEETIARLESNAARESRAFHARMRARTGT